MSFCLNQKEINKQLILVQLVRFYKVDKADNYQYSIVLIIKIYLCFLYTKIGTCITHQKKKKKNIWPTKIGKCFRYRNKGIFSILYKNVGLLYMKIKKYLTFYIKI